MGQGTPYGQQNSTTLREWISYVIQISSVNFHRNIVFVCYNNLTLRKQKITGLLSKKPVTASVREAVKQLGHISHAKPNKIVPDSFLQRIANRVSFHVDDIPGSYSDMMKFRGDLLSMMKKHGPPSLFLTLSSADTIWAKGFVEMILGKLSIEEARKLTAKERADLMAENPVLATMAWKRRLQTIIDLILNGMSKPVGDIRHYALTSE